VLEHVEDDECQWDTAVTVQQPRADVGEVGLAVAEGDEFAVIDAGAISRSSSTSGVMFQPRRLRSW
jgi:hypothetical protein